MAVEQPEGGLEGMGSQMKGTIVMLDTQGATFSQIRGEDGNIYRFHFGTCVDKIDTFNDLQEGMGVTFNNFSGKGTFLGAKLSDLKGGLVAVNVAIDTSGEVGTLVPATEGAVAVIMG